jgi:catechol-2,3-dioxygenase
MVRTVKTDNTWKERQARKRQRDKEERGIVGVTVRVHETRKADIKAVAATMLEPREEEQGK